MVTILAVVVFLVGVVLQVGGVMALAHWHAARAAAGAAARQWRSSGAKPEAEPAPGPGLVSGPSVLGFFLVVLASALLFLFAFHLGAA